MKILTSILATGICLTIGYNAVAFPQPHIAQVQSVAIQGPAHHGISIQTDGISDPNLSFYEVNIKPDNGQPVPPWGPYNTEIQPYDSKQIVVPYRDGVFSLKAGERYCVRIRGVYGNQVSGWSNSGCGAVVNMPAVPAGDTDNDGLDDASEYARGLDPRNRDVDGDGIPDGIEVDQGLDPESIQLTRLIIRQANINFGNGDRYGSQPNQHKYLEIENIGDVPALFFSMRPSNGQDPSVADIFKWGSSPASILALAPRNIARIPVSFFPNHRGLFQGSFHFDVNSDQPLPEVTLSGTGAGFADCTFSTHNLDFGHVAIGSQDILAQSFTVSNRPELGSELPANQNTPLSFTLISTDPEVVPVVDHYRLAPGAQVEVNVVFKHLTRGEHRGAIKISSEDCEDNIVEFVGIVE